MSAVIGNLELEQETFEGIAIGAPEYTGLEDEEVDFGEDVPDFLADEDDDLSNAGLEFFVEEDTEDPMDSNDFFNDVGIGDDSLDDPMDDGHDGDDTDDDDDFQLI